ncbi:hypothetical protein F485_gp224 [Aeromonas phage CC2]|uniref:Uncharacterized protein n=1 Tax=Aeromonas phage CC2 TaxID=1204516 RepID=I6XGZ9_9CAUD|nr:hypothetical protein F485_gp224 [Aeromonas phage CC2]AFN39331.1 hypothetical protein CC2_071 [Aeromonas phage CC2]
MFDKIVKFVNELVDSGFVNNIGKDEYSLVMKHFYGNSDSPLYIEDVKTHNVPSHHLNTPIRSTCCKGRLIVGGKENKIWESSYRHMFNQILQNHYGEVIVCNTELKVLIDTLNQVREMFRGVSKSHEIISRMMVNSIYAAINNRTDIIDKEEFNNIVERMFDNTVDAIVDAGGYPIFCELDKFIYVSPNVINFESSTHDDRLKNIMVVDGFTYVTDVDQKKSKRVRPVDVDNPKHLRYFNNLK